MPITAFNYVAANIEDRDGDVFFGADVDGFGAATPAQLYIFGASNEILVAGTSRDTPADSHGRIYMKGAELAISFNLMQTNYTSEFANVPDIVGLAYLMLKITETSVGAADQASLTTAAHAAAGVEFEGVAARFDFNLDFNGGDSNWSINISSRLSIAKIKDIGTNPVSLGSSGI